MTVLNDVDPAFWWEVATECPYATFFHTPVWMELGCRTYEHYEDNTIGAICRNGRRMIFPALKAGLPFKGLTRRAKVTSTFGDCYGDIIADGDTTLQDRETLYNHALRRQVATLAICGNPLAQDHEPVESKTSIFDVREDFTHMLDLTKGYERIISDSSKGQKSSLKKGLRMGVKVRSAASLADYRAYYGIYEMSLKRWGDDAPSKPYPWRLFECGFQLAEKYPAQMKLWLAEVDGTLVAGAWAFYWNQHVDWWHGAADAHYFDHCANNVLQAHIIQDAIQGRFRYYDLNPSRGLSGVIGFKESLGARRVTLRRWHYTHPLVPAYKKLNRIRNRISHSARA